MCLWWAPTRNMDVEWALVYFFIYLFIFIFWKMEFRGLRHPCLREEMETPADLEYFTSGTSPAYFGVEQRRGKPRVRGMALIMQTR